jgi:predicted Zn-dependent protease
MLTEPGAVMGTLAYMSPEQVQGLPLDSRTDLFSFGVVLCEMATGSRPAVAVRPNTGVPAELEPILSKCLEQDRHLRYQHASDIRADLQRLKRDSEPPRATSTAGASARWWKPAAAAAVVAALAAAGYLYLHRVPSLTDKDTIVLADFENKTGDPVFDGTLRQGLAVALEQSPFLSLISDERIHATLGQMNRKPDAPLTPEVAKEVCERAGGAAVLEGSIASLGSQYVLGLRAKNCRTGEVLYDQQVQAAKKEDVLNALSQIASKFRTRAGESLATIKQHETPLAEATTPSLDALKAYSAGWKVLTSGVPPAAIPFFKRAVEIDSKFAAAYASLGRSYGDIGESVLSAENTVKAYKLRDRASDAERFFIAATYLEQVTGNLEKAKETIELWAETYPREIRAPSLLSGQIYPAFGQWEKSIEAGQKSIALDPGFPFSYVTLATAQIARGRLPEAEYTLQLAAARKVEVPDLFVFAFQIAFVKGDQAGMDRAVAEGTGKLGTDEDLLIDQQALAQAYSGHLQKARSITQRAEDAARQAQQTEVAALFEAQAALREAFFGNALEARRNAASALGLSKGKDVQYGAAFALALSGDSSRAQALTNQLEKNFPEDTSVRSSYIPELRALLALNPSDGSKKNPGDPAKAVEALQVAAPYELGWPTSMFVGSFGPLYPIYVRGEAHLAAKKGAEAAAEFQKIVNHRGIVYNDPIGALAHLELGRAFVLAGDQTKARTAYQDFLTLWKDADPDIPILKQAKAEYAKLN